MPQPSGYGADLCVTLTWTLLDPFSSNANFGYMTSSIFSSDGFISYPLPVLIPGSLKADNAVNPFQDHNSNRSNSPSSPLPHVSPFLPSPTSASPYGNLYDNWFNDRSLVYLEPEQDETVWLTFTGRHFGNFPGVVNISYVEVHSNTEYVCTIEPEFVGDREGEAPQSPALSFHATYAHACDSLMFCRAHG